jgi:arsenate reductase (glutaredoxin)
MKLSKREILMYYKPDIKKDHNTYVLAKQITPHIHDIDVLKNPPTETQLMEILKHLGVPVEQIVERDSDIYKEKYEGKDLNTEGWVQAMVHDPDLIKTPIVLTKGRAILIETPSNVLDLDRGDYRSNIQKKW